MSEAEPPPSLPSETRTLKQEPFVTWKNRLANLFVSAVYAARKSDDTLNRRLLNFFDAKTRANSNPVHGVKSSDIAVDPTRDLWFRLFVPTTSAPSCSVPVIFFFHGGGFTFSSAASPPFDSICRQFCREIPAIVVSVNYRLSPEYRYPSQYDDGFDVVKFIDEKRELLPEFADVSNCFLAGDSAGANLAHHVTIRACRAGLRNMRIVGLMSIQPFFGGEDRTESEIRLSKGPMVTIERSDWHWKVFLPEGSNRDHEASNVSGPNGVDISGLDFPDTIVFVGGFDPLQDWQRRYYHWLRKCGKSAELVEYPNMIHGFYIFPEYPESSELRSEVKDFVIKRLSNSKGR